MTHRAVKYLTSRIFDKTKVMNNINEKITLAQGRCYKLKGQGEACSYKKNAVLRINQGRKIGT